MGRKKASRHRQQYGALCWRLDKGKPRILLVTSRGTGRWIIPKGWPVKGEDGPGSALVEAWEEAGVKGKAGSSPLGRYSYPKALDSGDAIDLEVEVWPVKVEKLARRFPERKQRRRKWFSPKKAADKVQEKALARMILAFGKSLDAESAAGETGKNEARSDTPRSGDREGAATDPVDGDSHSAVTSR